MNALEKYRPQWVYLKPAGTNEEPFDVPFSFTFNSDGKLHPDLPIQMDNEDCFIRGIFFNQISTIVIGEGPTYPFFLGRLRDTFGNPTSDAVTLMFGGWANPMGAACGFPIEPELRCQSGGVVLMDLQISYVDASAVTISGALLCVRRRKC